MVDKRSGIGSLSGNMNPHRDRSPNFRGSLSVEQDIPAGTKLWLCGWTRSGPDGCWWISISADVATKGGRARRPAVAVSS
jgi:hypothetical protein